MVACNQGKPKTTQKPTIIHGGTFLDQKSPGMIPELFAPELVSTNDLEIEAAISPTMDEFYFVRQRAGELPKSHILRYENGEWKESIMERPSGEVFISPDNKTMHLGSKYKERKPQQWGEEKSLGVEFEKFPIMRLSSSENGTFVFDEREEFGVIRYSALVNGKRKEPKVLGKNINAGKFTSHPFIAADESYLIWDSDREGGYGNSDLYISFRQKDGSWGAAINMGEEINTALEDSYGSVTMDGKYFFFHRVALGASVEESKANIYWVDAQLIEDLKKKSN